MSLSTNDKGDFFYPLNNAIIYDEASPYHQMMKKLYDIDVDYFDKIPAWTERIPTRLDFRLKSDILADFNALADQLLNQELKSRLTEKLLEGLHSDSGNCVISESEVRDTFGSLKLMIPVYFNQTKPCPEVEEAELQKKYRKAKFRSLWERITRTNGGDVFGFHQALMYRTVWECKALIEDRSLKFIEEVMLETIDK